MLPRFTCATSDPPAVAGVKSVTASDGTTSDVQVTDVSKSYVYIKPVNQAPQFDAPFVTTDGKAQLWINCCCVWRRAFGRFQRASASIGSRMRFGGIRPSARPCPAPQSASLPPASRHNHSFPAGSWKCAQDSSTS